MIYPFFEQHPYRADAATSIENDAKLALHIVLYLLSAQDPEAGTWPGTHFAVTLRNTCHALEALHTLEWGVAAGAVEAGVAWLVNLPGLFSLETDEANAIRLYPSRFKTLALLEEFNDAQLQRDFETLEEYLGEDGMVRGIMANQLLATLVYIDCLNQLEPLKSLSVLAQERRTLALNYVEHHAQLWYQDDQQNTRHAHITNPGDLSYAFDLLLQAEKLSLSDEMSQAIREAMLSTIDQPQKLYPIPSDAFYCGIQLATHFPENRMVRETVEHLISHIRTKYEKVDLNKETSFFHPLVLRLLFAFHGKRLKAEITRLMLEHERQHLELREQNTEQRLKDDFQELIKQRFEIDISDIQPLTGGFTRAKVFRVHFALRFASLSEEQEFYMNTYQPTPGSLVIKSDSIEALRTSIQQYRGLPDSLKPHFAKHIAEPQVIAGTSSYLVMEDLTYMNTFQHLIARIDQGRLASPQTRDLEKACTTICNNLFNLYDQTRQDDTDFFGSQLSRLYLSDIEENLIRMCRADKFPHLKSWLRGFWLGERKYLSIEHYLRKIESHKGKLRVPYLMLTHGDCHSRNIMLDTHLQQMKLIDLDHLDRDGDYIKDFALLLEDVCVFRFLFDEGYRLYLGNGASRFVAHQTKPKLIENQIEYPPFSSEAVRIFQRHILHHLETYAQTLHDEDWKARLWLALAAYLIFLVGKQEEKAYATVVYAEAIKLLDELVAYLDRGTPLNNIPFPGEHPADVAPQPARRNGSASPAWYHHSGLLNKIHEEMLALDPNIKYELSSSGQVVQYFSLNAPHPFAVIDGKKQPPTILLACSPDSLNDPHGVAQERPTESALQTVLHLSESQNNQDTLHLIEQAFALQQ